MAISGQRVIVVLGMHRSGTSPITRGLKALGMELGDDMLPEAPDNPTGFWEDVAIQEFNERLLRTITQAWDSTAPIDNSVWSLPEIRSLMLEAVEILRERFGKFPIWSFKDPRTARLLPFWQALFDHMELSDSYVLIIRNPISVARSLRRRDNFSLEKSYLLWLQHTTLAYCNTRGKQRVVVDYDLVMSEPRAQLNRIANRLALPLDSSTEKAIEDYIDGFLENSLRHSAYEPSDVSLDRHAPELVGTTFEVLRRAALDHLDLDSDDVQSVLASAQSSLEGFGPIFSYLEQLERQLRAATARESLQEHRITELMQQLNGSSVESAGLRSEIETARMTHATVTVNLERTKIQNSELAQQLTAAHHDLQEIRNSPGWMVIERYRGWVNRQSFRRPRLFGTYEKAALLVLRRLSGNTSKTHRSIEPLELRTDSRSTIVAHKSQLSNGESPAIWVEPTQESCVTRPLKPRTEAVDIVVCVHNAPEDTRYCLNSILTFTMPPFRIIIVDDGSSAETRDLVERFARIHGAMLIRHEQAKGYTFASNVGMRASEAPWVLLLNSDTIVTEGWLDRMVDLGQRDAQIGLVGPLSNTASWQSVPDVIKDGDWASNRLPDDIDIPLMGRLTTRASARQGIPLPFLNGFCLLVRRTMLDDIGLFDEVGFGSGYGEENDFCIRARNRGWQLLVADDVFVYHAHSKSYSHARRIELTRRADEALARKYNHGTDILPQVTFCRESLALAGARARVSAAIDRHRILEAGRARWEGKRIAFVLPVADGGGGANVVLQEGRALRRMGVDVWLVNLTAHKRDFELSYSSLEIPVLYAPDTSALTELLADPVLRFDGIVATTWSSFFWLPPQSGKTVLAYYVQDFEPLFLNCQEPEYELSKQSYILRSEVKLFSKTTWTAEQVIAVGGKSPVVIGPSVDIDLFRPAPNDGPKVERPVRVCAMLRPSTPRRSPNLTVAVLRGLRSRFGESLEAVVFGSSEAELSAYGLSTEGFSNLGPLRPRQVVAMLARSDVFLDFSQWQAMGLTALEAMASGCAVVVPIRGGAREFSRDGETALLADTDDFESCLAAATRLISDAGLRDRIRRVAIDEAVRHTPEAAAFRMMEVLFEAEETVEDHATVAGRS